MVIPLIIAGAALATSAYSAYQGSVAAGKQGKLAAQDRAEQAKQLGIEKQQGELSALLGEFSFVQDVGRLNDEARGALLQREELSMAARDLAVRRGALESAATLLSSRVGLVVAEADLASRGVALQERATRQRAVEESSNGVAQAQAALGSLDAIAQEAGLAGTTINALARQIGSAEGNQLGAVARAAENANAGSALDRQQIGQGLARSLVGLTAESVDLGVQGASQITNEQQQGLADARLDLTDAERGRKALDVSLARERSAAGLEARNASTAVSASRLTIGGAQQAVATDLAQSNAISGLVQSGLSIGASYYSGVKADAAQAKAYEQQLTLIKASRG